jgi:hypothetical protein
MQISLPKTNQPLRCLAITMRQTQYTYPVDSGSSLCGVTSKEGTFINKHDVSTTFKDSMTSGETCEATFVIF